MIRLANRQHYALYKFIYSTLTYFKERTYSQYSVPPYSLILMQILIFTVSLQNLTSSSSTNVYRFFY